LGKAFVLKIDLGSCFEKLKYFETKEVPRYSILRKKKLVTQRMA
jgi:hypothetical protein